MVQQPIRCLGRVLFTVIGVHLLTTPIGLRADDAVKPVAVLSIASVDQLMSDFTFLTESAGRADLAGYLQRVGPLLVEDFDHTRPAGVLITMADGQPKGVGFLPIPDVGKVLTKVREKLGAEVDDLGGGIQKLQLGKGAYLKQQGEWLFFTDHPRHLAQLPEDPVSMLGGLEKEYGIAVRFFVANIPQPVKDVADFSLQTKIDMDLKAAPSADPEIDTAFVESLRVNLKKWTSTLINESEKITIGWAVDKPGRRTYIDLRAQAKEGSSLSRQLNFLTNSRSTCTGFFVANAAAAFQGSIRVTDEGQQHIGALLQFVRQKAIKGIETDPDAPESLEEITTSVLDVVEKTVREGKTDVGAALLLAPDSFKFVAGVRVADGQALADAFQQLFELARHQGEVPEIRFYAGKHADLDLHTLSFPLADSDREARKILGENVDITIATGPESLYFALGHDSDSLLRAVVDKCQEFGPRQVPPLHLRVAVKPFARFLASIDKNVEQYRAMAELMERSTGGDGIELKVEPTENGLGCRLEIAAGVLELLGNASQR